MKATQSDISDRFWAKVERVDGCWLWRASRDRDGYGWFALNGKVRKAHRVAYLLTVGPIPDGLELDHLCRNRACVNPAHLEPVSTRENLMRSPITLASINAGKTHCINGHLFDARNTAITPEGHRSCRACRNESARRYRARRRGVKP